MNSRLYLVLILIAVIVISGCVQQGANNDLAAATSGETQASEQSQAQQTPQSERESELRERSAQQGVAQEIQKETSQTTSGGYSVWEGPFETKEIQLLYPSDWVQVGTSGLAAFSPKEKPKKSYVEVIVRIAGCGPGVGEIAKPSVPDDLYKYKIFESAETTIAGYPAHKLVYGREGAETAAKEMSIIVTQSDINFYRTFEYSVRYYGSLAETEKIYDKYLKTGEGIINSLKVLPAGKAIKTCVPRQ